MLSELYSFIKKIDKEHAHGPLPVSQLKCEKKRLGDWMTLLYL